MNFILPMARNKLSDIKEHLQRSENYNYTNSCVFIEECNLEKISIRHSYISFCITDTSSNNLSFIGF